MKKMKECDYSRSMSSLDLGQSVVHSIFISETAGPITEKFSCGASMGRGNENSVYGKNHSKIFFSRTGRLIFTKLSM